MDQYIVQSLNSFETVLSKRIFDKIMDIRNSHSNGSVKQIYSEICFQERYWVQIFPSWHGLLPRI